MTSRESIESRGSVTERYDCEEINSTHDVISVASEVIATAHDVITTDRNV
jgi:hypothetical protein